MKNLYINYRQQEEPIMPQTGDTDLDGADEEGSLFDKNLSVPIISQPTQRFLKDVLSDIRSGELILQPEFQRDFVWPKGKQRELIKSIYYDVPLPMFYFAKSGDGQREVIDGQQRLTTIAGLVDSSMLKAEVRARIAKPPRLKRKSDGKSIPESELRRKAIDTGIYIVEVPSENLNMKYEIFRLLNQGAFALKPQEIRNSILVRSGPDIKKELEWFARKLEILIGDKFTRKLGEELALRFFLIQIHGLDASIRNKLNDIDRIVKDFDGKKLELRKAARKFFEFCEKLYKNRPDAMFQALSDDGAISSLAMGKATFSGRMNQAMFHVLAFFVPKYDRARLSSADMDEVRKSFFELLRNDEFRDATTKGSTNSEKNIRNAKNIAEGQFFQPALGVWAEPPARMITKGEKNALFKNIQYCYLTYRKLDRIKDAEFDHIEPFAKNAVTEIGNILPSWPDANGKKKAMTIEEYRKTRFFLTQRKLNKQNIAGFIECLSAWRQAYPSQVYDKILRLARRDLREMV